MELPELPEGQRWRVWNDSMGIQVDTPHKTWFRHRVVHCWDVPDDAHWSYLNLWEHDGCITPDLLQTTAREIMQAVDRQQKRQDSKKTYVGSYPPKRLES